MIYLHRNAQKLLEDYLRLFPGVAVTGPRQSGKSTMVRQCLPDTPYVTFDDPEEEFAFKTDPKGFLARFPGQVILDEAHRECRTFSGTSKWPSTPSRRGKGALS